MKVLNQKSKMRPLQQQLKQKTMVLDNLKTTYLLFKPILYRFNPRSKDTKKHMDYNVLHLTWQKVQELQNSIKQCYTHLICQYMRSFTN